MASVCNLLPVDITFVWPVLCSHTNKSKSTGDNRVSVMSIAAVGARSMDQGKSTVAKTLNRNIILTFGSITTFDSVCFFQYKLNCGVMFLDVLFYFTNLSRCSVQSWSILIQFPYYCSVHFACFCSYLLDNTDNYIYTYIFVLMF